MLKERTPLFFPEIKFVRDDKIINKTTKESKTISIYKLDWSKCEEIKQENHKKWQKQYYPKCNVPWVDALPKKWMDETSSQLFAITNSYMSEIRRNCHRAIEEWNIQRSFDTCIRDMCLIPAIGHVYVSFKLLCDCLYDNKNYYFLRDCTNILPHAMLYRFWHHQTGRGLVQDHSYFEKLYNRMSRIFDIKDPQITKRDMEIANKISEFIVDIKKHEEDFIFKAYEKISKDVNFLPKNK